MTPQIMPRKNPNPLTSREAFERLQRIERELKGNFKFGGGNGNLFRQWDMLREKFRKLVFAETKRLEQLRLTS